MRVLILDNYDSFTWNLQHYVKQFTDEVEVKLNDQISLEEVDAYTHIILSPGPGLPKDAGIMPEVISRYYQQKKIMGVCLGMQALVEFFGGTLRNLPEVLHGIQNRACKTNIHETLFDDLPETFLIGHYHSWVADESSLPGNLLITSRDEKELIMSLRHADYDIYGMQFHPESVLTENGISIIRRWLN